MAGFAGFGQDIPNARGLIRRGISLIGSVFALVVLLVASWNLIEGVDASEIVLIQSPTGTLTWHTTPGWVWQGFGKVTRYKKRDIIEFQRQFG